MEELGQTIYRAGPIEIDARRRSILRKGVPVHLRPRTFDLLLYLVEHRDRVVGQQELLENLWAGTAVTANSVMQCVNEARRILGDDPHDPQFIRTVAKAGYQFIGTIEPHEELVEHVTSVQVVVETDEARSTLSGRLWRITLAGAAVVLVLAAASLRSRGGGEPRSEIAWWKLDEGSGAGIADSVHKMPAPLPRHLIWVRGVSGSALRFPGPEIVVRGTDPGILPRGYAPRSFSAWIRTTTTNGDTTVIFQQGNPNLDSGSDHFYLALQDTGVASFGSSDVVFGRSRVDDGQWRHIAGVFEGGGKGAMHLYVDGAEDANPVRLQGPFRPESESQWAIGRRLRGGTSFRGEIDDVRVFGRALRPAEIRNLVRCMNGPADIEIGGRPYYFGQIHGSHVEMTAGEKVTALRNTGNDFAGAAFLARQPGCPVESLRSADIGQDFHFEAELKLDPPQDLVTEAGPYFRSRRAEPGDGILGGTSAGFWVQLASTGQVRVIRLHPMATIAFSNPLPGFDRSAFHKIAADVRGQSLRVALDGVPVVFDSGGKLVSVINLAPQWQTATPPGHNEGSAGLAFSSVRNRGRAGGQVARNIRVTPYPDPADVRSGLR